MVLQHLVVLVLQHLVSVYWGYEDKEEQGGVEVDQVVTTQEWVHVSKVCGLFACDSCLMLYPGTLLKSPDGHDGNGVGLAVVEEVEGEDVVEWVHSYYGMGLGQHFHKKMRDGVGQGISVVGFWHAVNKN